MAQGAVDLATEKATVTTNGRSITVGDFELTMFSDGNYWLDGGPLFGIIPKVMWLRKVACDENNRIFLGLNSLLIRGGSKTVLVETGIGNKFGDRVREVFEPEARLLGNLTAAGTAPDSIDVVINTHLHFDHCGWNTVRANGRVVPTFPRATYYAPEGEWQHGQKQHLRDRVSYISDNYNPLLASGQMKLVKDDREIIPGVSVRTIPGHTRYMQVVMIESQGQKACYVSDLIPTTMHLDLLWIMAYDLFPMEAIANKKSLYDEAIPGRWLVIFTHDPAIPWGYVKEIGKGKYGLEPVI